MWPMRQDETQALRYKQIDSLRSCFPTVKEVTRDLLYEVPIIIPRRPAITLRVNLPPDFPRAPPVLQISPPSLHKLVDSQQCIIPQAHENLLRWTVHASLGKTVYEIVQKLMQDPPQLLPPQPQSQSLPPSSTPISTSTIPMTSSSLPATSNSNPMGMALGMMNPNSSGNVAKPPPPYIPGSISGSNLLQHQQYQQQQQQQQQKNIPNNNSNSNVGGGITHTPQPVIPSTFPEVESKTPSELGHILNDDDEFKKLFDSLSCVQTMRKVRDDLRANNEELAKKNLAKEAEVERARRELSSRMQVVAEKRSAYESKAQRQQEVMKQFSTSSLIDSLTVAAGEAETASDAIADKFLSGEMDQKDFVREFMEKRKLYHLRSAKKESLLMLSR